MFKSSSFKFQVSFIGEANPEIFISFSVLKYKSHEIKIHWCWLIGWLDVWVLWYINLCRLFNTKSIFMKIVLFQTIQFSISKQFDCKYSLWKTFLFQAIQCSQAVLIQRIQFSKSKDFVYSQLNVKTVLYQTNQFSVSRVSMSKNISISNNSV